MFHDVQWRLRRLRGVITKVQLNHQAGRQGKVLTDSVEKLREVYEANQLRRCEGKIYQKKEAPTDFGLPNLAERLLRVGYKLHKWAAASGSSGLQILTHQPCKSVSGSHCKVSVASTSWSFKLLLTRWKRSWQQQVCRDVAVSMAEVCEQTNSPTAAWNWVQLAVLDLR